MAACIGTEPNQREILQKRVQRAQNKHNEWRIRCSIETLTDKKKLLFAVAGRRIVIRRRKEESGKQLLKSAAQAPLP